MLNLYFATNFACNLRCKYCYLPEYQKSGNKRADDLAVAAARSFIAKCNDEGIELGHVVLHGAESGLLSPVAAATIASEFARASNYRFSVGVQSNGTLFNDCYFEQFEANANDNLVFSIGISIDGPASITDSVRGNGVYRRASAGLDAANRRGYKTQILCVVGSHTLQALDEFESWMRDLIKAGQDIRFKPAYGAYKMNEDEQLRFALWLDRTGYARFYQEISKDLCVTKGNNCFWLEVDVNGGCYSCNKAFGETGIFANWKTDSLSQILERRKTLYHARIANPACDTCEIYSICHSGCPLDRSDDGLAIDCQLKRSLLKTASNSTGIPWAKIIDSTTQFQRSTLIRAPRNVLQIRQRNQPNLIKT